MASGDVSCSGTGSVRPAIRPNAVGGSVRRLVCLPAAMPAPDLYCFGVYAEREIFNSVSARACAARTLGTVFRSAEVLSKGGSPGPATRCRNLDRNAGRRGNLSVFAFRPDGYRSGLSRLSGARLFGTGPYAFMSSTDIFRSGRSGRERGPLASFSRRQIFRPRLHKPGEPP